LSNVVFPNATDCEATPWNFTVEPSTKSVPGGSSPSFRLIPEAGLNEVTRRRLIRIVCGAAYRSWSRRLCSSQRSVPVVPPAGAVGLQLRAAYVLHGRVRWSRWNFTVDVLLKPAPVIVNDRPGRGPPPDSAP